MRLLNSHRFGSATPPSSLLYDNVLAMYSLRRPNMSTTWTKAALRASIEGTNKRKYVFFDTNGVVSLSSLVGDDYTTASAETLATWAGTGTVLVKYWMAITPDNIVDEDLVLEASSIEVRNPVLMTNGSILLSNSKPTISFQKTTIQEMTAKVQGISGMSDSDYFSVISVTENKKSLNTGKFLTNAASGGLYFHHDTSASKTMLTVSPSSLVYTSANVTVDQQRSHLITHTPVVAPTQSVVKAYYNNILQNTLSAYTSFNNQGLKIGGDSQNSNDIFVGNISEIIIMDEDVSSSYTTYFNEVNSYYQTY